MTIRLYFDEDASIAALAAQLRARGIEVTTAVEAGTLGVSDEQQLAWAVSHGCALYSFNRGDFHALHTNWMNRGLIHLGIVLARQDLSIGEQLRRLLRLLWLSAPRRWKTGWNSLPRGGKPFDNSG